MPSSALDHATDGVPADPAAAPSASATVDADDAPRTWTPLQRVAFRFVFVYLLLYNLSFPLQSFTFAYTDETWYSKLWEPMVAWVGAHMLRLGTPIVVVPVASADTRFDWVQVLCYLAVSAIAAAVWTAVDRRRAHYAQAHDFIRAWVRYNLAFSMAIYGAAKVIQTQFAEPMLADVIRPLGQFSSPSLLWAFMSASYAYNLFAGLGEVVGGVLLFWRRTTTLGAAILVGVLANVVVINFAYDVPVKLYSTHLLLMTLFLLAPQARRFANFFVLNRPVAPVRLGRFLDGRWRVARAVLKPLVIAFSLGLGFTRAAHDRQTLAEFKRIPLYGIYDVERFARNGRTVPPPLVDRRDWGRVVFSFASSMVVKTVTDSTFGYAMEIDTAAGRMELYKRREPAQRFALRYARPAPGVVRMTGVIAGDTLDVRLKRVDETKLMPWRKPFRWVVDPAAPR